MPTSPPTNALATSAAVSQRWPRIISSHAWPSMPTPVTDWLTATPEMLPIRPDSVAPIVPEWYTDRPTLAPGLIPETTRSNGAPNAPSRANMTHSAGGPFSDQASSMPSTGTRCASGWARCSAPTAAPAPENSRSGR